MDLLREYSEGLICMSACLKGVVPEKMLKGDYEGARKEALLFANISRSILFRNTKSWHT